ncbi:hypothetical protein Scep_005112 [Stephania cephalantha]|uniref:Uncharacterized protein n=1 Tax=Stephania cephalantha TaxID=152367 RepID=A0AAP0KV35_9MAGN
MQYVKMFTVFMVQLQSILPPDTNIPDAFTNGSGEEQVNASLFYAEQFTVATTILVFMKGSSFRTFCFYCFAGIYS